MMQVAICAIWKSMAVPHHAWPSEPPRIASPLFKRAIQATEKGLVLVLHC